MKLIKKTVSFGIVLLFLQGCIGNKSFVDSRVIDTWDLSGKIGIVYPSKQCQRDYCPPRSEQGNLTWQQKKSAYNIALSDPFGRVVLTLTGDEQRLLATAPGKSPIQTTPNEFMSLLIRENQQKAALSQLSPKDLRYWITGRPVPKVAHEQQGSSDFVQKGFTVSSRQWRKTPVGNMPALVVIKKEQFKLRVVIREWNKFAQ